MRIRLLALFLLLASLVQAQNYTDVLATNIVDIGNTKVPSGKLCFQAFEAGRPISFMPGGGGQAVRGPKCASITNGAIVGSLQVANPTYTTPSSIKYTITILKPSGAEILRYDNVPVSGSTFNFDSYIPTFIIGKIGLSGTNLALSQWLTLMNIVQPATPAAGTTLLYADSSSKLACSIDDAGVKSCTGGVGGAGSGTVTSVGLTAPGDFTVTGSPVTSSGTLAIAWVIAPASANTASAIVKRDASGDFTSRNITATSFIGALTGNASTVTNGLYSTGSYADPTWLTSLAGSKISSAVANATLAAAATALVADPSDCSAEQYAISIVANGNLGCARPSSTQLGDFSTTVPSSSGKIPIWDQAAANAAGGTGAYVPGDPLVQGLYANAATTEANPVQIGGFDGVNVRRLSIDTSGRPNVNIHGTVPVSSASLPLPNGAATSVKQPALGAAGTPSADVITVQGATSMTALKMDGSAVTQPVSAVSLPLPNGAATSVKQPALGAAGTPSADVITVQGATSMTALKVDGSAVTQPVNGTVTANIGTSGSLALDATLTGGSQKTKLVDSGGTNVATVSAAGAVKTDGSAVTQPVSIATLPSLAAGSAVIGHVIADSGSTTAVTGTVAVQESSSDADPCQNPNQAKSSAVISLASTTATAQVALTTSQVIYVCGIHMTLAGTTPSAVFSSAASCGTSPTNLTGTMLPTSGTFITMGYGGTIMQTAASQALCLTLAGTSPSAQGVVTYVKK